MNRTEARQLKEELSSGSLMRATERNLSHDEGDKIESICKNIQQQTDYDWTKDMKKLSPGAKFILYEEVAARFPHYLSSNIRVSFQGVESLGVHFACLCREFDFYEVKKNYYFSKRKGKYRISSYSFGP